MSAVTVALVGSKDLGAELAKRGTTSDLTLDHLVQDGHALTIVEPTHYPEKFAALLFALEMADRVLLVVDALNREFAESLATTELFAKPTAVVIGPGVGESELRRALKGTALETVELLPRDLPRLRELLGGWSSPARDGAVLVPIDHAFPVKGVGAVALGLVARGTVHAHDKLRLYPDPRSVEVRSLQVHDVDVKEASSGERVGLALRGIEADELSRGQMLAPEGTLEVTSAVRLSGWTPCRYYRAAIHPGTPMHALIGLQFVPAGVTIEAGGNVALETDRPVAGEDGNAVYLADLDASPGPRIVGRGRWKRG